MTEKIKPYLFSSSFSIVLIGLISLFIVSIFVWNGKDTSVIESDGKGYYAYLPNTFINHNLKTQKSDTRYFKNVNGKVVNKYYVGTSVVMSPFFILGHTVAKLNREKLDGYSSTYQKSISLAGIFYLLFGLIFLRLFLIQFKVPDKTIVLTLFLILFGTNLLSYALFQPSMSHVYSWGFICGFLFFSKMHLSSSKLISFLLAALFLGIIILIRPLNGLIVLILPFLSGSLKHFYSTIKSSLKLKNILWSMVLFSSVIFIQLYFWKIQSGNWIVWSYQHEGFNFWEPQLWNVLFSFRKGLFVYSPLILLSLFGLFFLYKKSRFQFFSLFIFFFIITYFISSWWNWYYGPSFGQRPFVEFYGVIALLLSFVLLNIKSKLYKSVIIVLCFLLVGLNLVQTYQYHNKIISSWDMNFKKYRYTFLKTSDKYKNSLGGNNDIFPYKANEKSIYKKTVDFENKMKNIEFGKTKREDNSLICDYTNSKYNFSLFINCDSSFVDERGVYLKVKLDKKDLFTSFKNEALFVLDIQNSNRKTYHYYTFPVNEIPPVNNNKWNTENYSIEIPEIKSSTDIIKLYVWNKGEDSFYLDNIKVEVFKIN